MKKRYWWTIRIGFTVEEDVALRVARSLRDSIEREAKEMQTEAPFAAQDMVIDNEELVEGGP